ncbi:hypothetical protein CEXT_622641 [Caerostris extrusa]|uniref:Uncharacterized protein n=1 Tax=Caerostris extrusa TaxID=172846 RepID=A0AAV4WT32_CAEEX|nr:hypothetical protein CEXT_622641 [Caerostris extrusa]
MHKRALQKESIGLPSQALQFYHLTEGEDIECEEKLDKPHLSGGNSLENSQSQFLFCTERRKGRRKY